MNYCLCLVGSLLDGQNHITDGLQTIVYIFPVLDLAGSYKGWKSFVELFVPLGHKTTDNEAIDRNGLGDDKEEFLQETAQQINGGYTISLVRTCTGALNPEL